MPWLQTRNDIIKRALRIIGAVAQGETPNAEQIDEGATALNSLVLSLSNEDIKLWKRVWLTKTLTASSVVTGTDFLNYTCIRSHTASASNRPVTGAEWPMYWKQTGTGGSAWVNATAYTAIGDFLIDEDVIRVIKFMGRLDGTDHDIEMVNYDVYFGEFDKAQTSSYPSYVWLDRGIQQRAYLSPQPDGTSLVIHYYADKVIPEITTAASNPDFHGKMYDLLSYNLARVLADEYGIGINERNWIKGIADELKRNARMSDDEDTGGNFIKGAY